MSEAAPNPVVVRELTRRFGDFTAVDAVTFDVRPGEIFGFLGPNGAGKTTTIKMLTGLLPPTEGEGRVAGLDIRTERQGIKRRIGYMSQKFSLYTDLTVRENIDLFDWELSPADMAALTAGGPRAASVHRSGVWARGG